MTPEPMALPPVALVRVSEGQLHLPQQRQGVHMGVGEGCVYMHTL